MDQIHNRALARKPDNLFGWQDWPPEYPHVPGWKGTDTSREAAKAIAPSAKTLRGQVLGFLKRLAPDEALTADQIAVGMQRSILSIRPRVSELAAAGAIVRGDKRGKNESGMSAATWRAA